MPPLGGQIKFTPGADKQQASGPGESAAAPGGEEQAQGDGYHHHELHQHESGFHSKHTHPDGRTEDADHADYEEAKAHMDQQMGEGEDMGDGDGDEAMQPGGGDDAMPDFSGAYARGK